MKILVVDDSKAMRMIVRRTLRQAGYGGHDIVEACDGQAAFDTIGSEAVDLVLCDWNMPMMTGMELLQQLRATGSDVRFGFVTSEGSEEIRLQALEAGAQFLIAKPFTPDVFREALDRAVG